MSYLNDAARPNVRTMAALFIYIVTFNLIVQSPRFVSSQHIRGDIDNGDQISSEQEAADSTLQIRLPPKIQDVLRSNRVDSNRRHIGSDMVPPPFGNGADNKTNKRILFPTTRRRYISRERSTISESSETSGSHSADSETPGNGPTWMRRRQSLFNPTTSPQLTSSEYNVNLFSPEIHVTTPEIPYGYKGGRHPIIPTIQPVFTSTTPHEHSFQSHGKGTKGGRYPPFIPKIPPVFTTTTPTTIHHGHDIEHHGIVTKHPEFHGKGHKGRKGGRRPFIPSIPAVFTTTTSTIIHEHDTGNHEVVTEHPIIHGKGHKGGIHPPFVPTIPPEYTPTIVHEHPVVVTEHPVVVTEHPVVVTEHPVVVTQHPVGVTEHPVVVTEHPVVVTEHPVVVTEHPVVVTEHPVVVTEHPVVVTEHPVVVTEHPVVVTEHPVVVTEHPVVVTEHPIIHGKGHKGGIHPPFIPTIPPEYTPTIIHEHPVVVTEHPVVVTEHPVVVTEHPVVVTEHPVVVTEHPVVVTEHPVVVTEHPVVVTEHPVVVTEHPIIHGKGHKGGIHPPFIPTIPPEYTPTIIHEHHGVTQQPPEFHGKGTKGGRHPYIPTIPPVFTTPNVPHEYDTEYHEIETEQPSVFHGKGTKESKGGKIPFNPTIPPIFSQTTIAATVNDYHTTDGYTDPKVDIHYATTAANLPTYKEESNTIEIPTTEPSTLIRHTPSFTVTQDYQNTATSSIDKTEHASTITPPTLDLTTHHVVIDHNPTIYPEPNTDHYHAITTEPQSDEFQKTTQPTYTVNYEIHKPTTIPTDFYQETTAPHFPTITYPSTPGIVTTHPDIYQQTTVPVIHITMKIPTTADTHTTNHDFHQTTEETPYEVHTTHTDDMQQTTDPVYPISNDAHKPTEPPSYDFQTTEPVVYEHVPVTTPPSVHVTPGIAEQETITYEHVPVTTPPSVHVTPATPAITEQETITYEHVPVTTPPSVHVTPATPAITEQETIIYEHVPVTTPPSVHLTPATPAITEQETIIYEHVPVSTPPSVHITPVTPAWTGQTTVHELIPVVPQVPTIIIDDDDQHQEILPVAFPTDQPSIEDESSTELIDVRGGGDDDDDVHQETIPLPDYNSGPPVINSWHTSYHGYLPQNHTPTIYYPLQPIPSYEFTVSHHPPSTVHTPIQPIIPYHPVALIPAHSVYTWSHQHAPNLPSTLSPQYSILEQTDVKGHATYAANRPDIKGRGGQVDWETQKPLPVLHYQ